MLRLEYGHHLPRVRSLRNHRAAHLDQALAALGLKPTKVRNGSRTALARLGVHTEGPTAKAIGPDAAAGLQLLRPEVRHVEGHAVQRHLATQVHAHSRHLDAENAGGKTHSAYN